MNISITDAVNSVNEHKGEWPTGYVMSIYSGNTEIFQAGFNEVARQMSTNFGSSSLKHLEIWQKNHSLEFRVVPFKEVKPVTPPIYTQEMHDNGVLPSVGMECLFFKDARLPKAEWTKGTFAGKVYTPSGGAVFLFTDRKTRSTHFVESMGRIKPLTPSVVLEDGKAYQFTCHSGDEVVGIYSAVHISFDNYGRKFYESSITNIRPLTVEVKS